jgi:PAS domain S-box-containing protein
MNESPGSVTANHLPIQPTELLEEAPHAWVLSDAGGTIRFINKRAEEMFGYTREELFGERVEILIPQRFHDVHLGHRAGFMERPAVRPMGLGMELTARRKDGSEFPVEISLSPIETAQGLFITAVVQDISDRLEQQEERNSLRVELEMERERDRIGMDLHDGIMQEIYAAGLTLELALSDVKSDPEAAEAEIERSIDQLHEVIRNIRSYIFDLRPRQFAGTLSGALAELAREFRQNTQIEVTEDVPESLPDVEMGRATAAYHIVHEALSNVRKHADASQVSLSASRRQGEVSIEVRDNGRGFDLSADVPQVHRGLRNMSVRARNAGCGLDVRSAPGGGTCVTVSVPLES